MRVRGENDPTDPDDDETLLDPPSLSREAEAVRAIVVKNGYHPYRLHVAVDYVPGCVECFGYRCPIDCKSDGANRALKRAMATGLVRLETDFVVDRVAARDGVATVTVRDTGGRESERRARRVVLSAGALNTPLILERSADLWKDKPRPPMLAKGLMFHVSDIFALRTVRRSADASPRKWLAIRDLYEDGVANLGDIQSTGTSIGTGTIMQGLRDHASRVLPGRLLLLAEFLRPAAWLVARYLGPQSVYATIVEDMPFASNSVREEQGRIVVAYEIDPGLKTHATRMRSRVRAIFSPLRVRFLTGAPIPNWGHPMGTCRMGTDPATSVTGPGGRLHGHEEIYVADASAFPSSGGAGPALTVVAHAFQVADRIAAELDMREARAFVSAAE